MGSIRLRRSLWRKYLLPVQQKPRSIGDKNKRLNRPLHTRGVVVRRALGKPRNFLPQLFAAVGAISCSMPVNLQQQLLS